VVVYGSLTDSAGILLLFVLGRVAAAPRVFRGAGVRCAGIEGLRLNGESNWVTNHHAYAKSEPARRASPSRIGLGRSGVGIGWMTA